MSTQGIPSESELAQQVPQFSFLDRLADELAGSVCSVFGSPVERDGVTVIPVAKARWGMGGGSGAQRAAQEAGSEAGVKAGGGAMVKPIGFIELANGKTKFRPIRDPDGTTLAMIATGFLGLSAVRALAMPRRRGIRLRLARRSRARRLRRLFR